MSLKSKRLEVRKAMIIEAAKGIFDEVGYEKATLDMIGESVGLTKQTLYHYIKSKEDLMLDVCLSSPVVLPIVTLRLSRNQGKSPLQLIARYIEDSISLMLGDVSARLMVKYLPFASKSAQKKVIKDLRAELDELEQSIRDGMESGEFIVNNPRSAAHVIQDAVHMLAYRLSRDEHLSAGKISRDYVDFLMSGLGVRAHTIKSDLEGSKD